MLKPRLLEISLGCLLSLPAVAQQNVPPSRTITLNVTALNKSGQPVSGLAEQDFTLLDNKVPQKITSFRAVQGATANPPVHVILVIDEVNDSFVNVSHERQQIASLLKRSGGKMPLPLSLVFFTDKGLTVPTPPAQDAETILAELNDNKNPQRSITRSQGFYGASDRLDLSLRALEQLGAYELKQPGRKLVIWISPGWPLLSGPRIELSSKNEQQIFNTIVSLSAELRDAQVTIDSIDPLGTSDSGGLRTVYYEQFLKGVKDQSKVQFGDLGLQVLAYQSGGRVLNSSNDTAGEIATCIADANSYYVLTFEPAVADGPNDYHALDLKIDKPGLTARTRTGYYAQPQ